MLITILHWAFTFFVCFPVGNLVLHFLYALFLVEGFKIQDFKKNMNKRVQGACIMSCLIAGMAALTVYAQLFSIFTGVGIHALGLAVIISLFSCIYFKKETKEFLSGIKNVVFSWQGLWYFAIVLIVAFYASRGVEHHDTGLYHAQAIRWIEEYGLVPGLGNLFGNYAYNSAYFAFVALFSLEPFFGISLHTATGFLAVAMCIYAFERFKDFGRHTDHVPDFIMAAAVFYTIIFAATLSAPASDAPVAYLTIYFIARFAEIFADAGRDEHVKVPERIKKKNVAFNSDSSKNSEISQTLAAECFLSIALVWLVSIKFSAALIVLLALVPLWELLKQRRYRVIIVCIAAGLVVITPFLIRNYFISGYLIYPFPSIDIFNPDWKMPLDYLKSDANLIGVYGKFLHKIDEADIPTGFLAWVPVWWRFSERYEQKLVLAGMAAFIGFVAILLQRIISRKGINYKILILNMICLVNLAFWFVSAPFIRYGLGFLLAYPFLFLGRAWDMKMPMNPLKMVFGGCVFLCLWLQSPYLDHYIMDNLVLAARYVRADDKYLIWPKDYERYDTLEYEIEGVTFYRAADGGQPGYYGFPGSPGSRSSVMSLRGNGVKDGFVWTED